MVPLPTSRRKLFMHPAHRTIGVLGFGHAVGDCRQVEDFLANNAEREPSEDDGGKPEDATQDEDVR